MGTGSFPGVKRPERGADHPPLLAPRLRKSGAIPLLPIWAFGDCYRVNFTLLPAAVVRRFLTAIRGHGRAVFFPVFQLSSTCQYHTIIRFVAVPASAQVVA
jgi:hypothetical protein